MGICTTKKVDFYKTSFSNNIDRGELKDIAHLERHLSPAIDLNYRKFLPQRKDAKILDIGCGWGYFLYYLKKNGYSDIKGIDLEEHAGRIEFVRNNVTKNIEGISNLEEYLNSHRNEYDWIMLQQVIYYFNREDLLPIMRGIKNSLKLGGILIVETFNGSLLTSAFIQNTDYQRKLIFTEYSLATLLQDAGFELEDLFGMVFGFKKSPKSIIWMAIQRIWVLLLKLVYILERGVDPQRRPHIFSKHLIAIAKKV